MAPHIQLILGGARSGKSRFALHQKNENSFKTYLFLATAHPGDSEMKQRIEWHRKERDPFWKTVEVPYDLVESLRKCANDERGIIVLDCSTLWISNLLCGFGGKTLSFEEAQKEIVRFQESLLKLKGTLRIVSNEVGLGIVPDNLLSRSFRDLQGQFNQSIALIANEVILMVAGIAQKLK
jgi:adenosylcobinamide kinase/adenosylcobinamide-phosphate guanylyltransferase